MDLETVLDLCPVSEPTVPPAVDAYLARSGQQAARIVALTGDASDRRYFRVVPPVGSSFVLSVHAAPFDYGSLPFVNVAGLLEEMPLPVPRILGEAADLGVLALEDLGDVTLQARLGAAPDAERLALYRQAVTLIEVIQRRGRDLSDARFVPYGVSFDVEKLTWEMQFFLKHFLEAYCRAVPTKATRSALDAEFATLVRELAAEPRVLCHRDYHSRNLMLRGGRLFVIDFQDARMGPDTYDLASLLRDSYVDLSDTAVRALIGHYLELTGRASEGPRFRERFDLMSLQRNLKALGTFGYQTTAKNNPVYVQYIPRTLRYARENLCRYERFARLRGLLAELGEEFRE
jgi:aminoglycoside/choline kinase family phosphotransferase